MSHLERKPFFQLEKAWKESDRMPDKIKFESVQATDRRKASVTPYSGDKGIEFLLDVTNTEFDEALRELRWEDHAIFNNYRKVLTDSARTTWDEVISDQFSDAEDRITANYALARRTFIRKLLVCDRPRDVQLRYLQVGGGAKKDPFMSTEGHMRRWKQVYRNSLKLPKGSMGKPRKNEVLEWYYWSYPKRWRLNYLAAPKDLYGDSIEGITKYMRLQEQKDKTDGTAACICLQATQDRSKRDRLAKERERRKYRSSCRRAASYSPERRQSSKKKARSSYDERRNDCRSSGSSRYSYHCSDDSRSKRYDDKDNKD